MCVCTCVSACVCFQGSGEAERPSICPSSLCASGMFLRMFLGCGMCLHLHVYVCMHICVCLYPRHMCEPWGIYVAFLYVYISGVECCFSSKVKNDQFPQEAWTPERVLGLFSHPQGSVHLRQLRRVKNSPGASGSGRGRGTRRGRVQGGRHPQPLPALQGQPAWLQQGGPHILPPHLRGFRTPQPGASWARPLRKAEEAWDSQPDQP